MPGQNIRSSIHRQVLLHLRRRSATVSQVANALNLRMPHASLACKQLKIQGWVHRDESSGLRNAPFSLTHEGLLGLEADALAKIGDEFNDIPRQQTGVVLQAEGKDVLIGYAEQPESSFLFIPEHQDWAGDDSKGNQGGWWLHAPKEEVNWFDVDTLDPTSPPASPDAVVLASFTSSRAVGLVRARLIESSSSISLVRGRWFSSTRTDQAPSVFTQGPVHIGSIRGTSLSFGPPPQCWIELPNASERRMLVNAYADSSVVLTDSGVRQPPQLPYGVLLPWLINRHPRMSESKRLDLWTGLRASLGESGLAAGAIERAVVSEFGPVTWNEHALPPGVLDTRDMNSSAVLAVIEHLRDRSTGSFVVDWNSGSQDAQRLVDVTNHPTCRAVIVRSEPQVLPPFKGCWLSSHPDFGVVNVNLSGMKFTVRLQFAESGAFRSVRFPASAIELQRGLSHEGLDAEGFTAHWPNQHRALLEQALFKYPKGDERLASQFEHRSPLAAWIASPPHERAHRALRMASLLPDKWIELLPVDDLPVRVVPDVLAFGGLDWQAQAMDRYAKASHHDATLLEPLAAMLQSEPPNRSAVLLFLCTPGHHVSGLSSLFTRACEAWWEAPTHVTTVLQTVFGGQGVQEGLVLVDEWLARSKQQPTTSELRQWGQVLTTINNGEPFLVNTQRWCMERFPIAWWMAFAQDWLLAQLASVSGRTWLAQHPFPWGAIVARTPGERCGVPGASMLHPGLTLTESDILPVRLLPEGSGVQPLNDLLTMLRAEEQGQPVPRLATHADGGWLVRPVSDWPLFNADVFNRGCSFTALLLLGRQYAATFGHQR